MKNNHFKFWISLVVFVSSLFVIPAQLQAKDIKDKIKKGIEEASDFLKKEVDNISGDIKAVQEYLDNYSWKGIIQDHATSGVATLSHLKLNGHSRAAAVQPGEKIEGILHCHLDPQKCNSLSFYRVLIGIKGVGPQVTVCNYLGASAGDSKEKFILTAPEAKGIYQIRFRVVESFLESEALQAWADAQGQEPDASTTIGVIVVK